MSVGRGQQLFYRRYGSAEGLPLLLIRPLGGTIALWGRLLTALDPSLRAIVFDPLGVGRSQGPARVSVGALAEDALSVLDACGIGQAAVLGQSLGGFVAMRLAARWPERVRDLVLASTALRGTSFSAPPWRRGLACASCLLAREREIEVCFLHHTLRAEFVRRSPEEVRFIESCLRAEPTRRSTLLRHDLAAARYRGDRDVRGVKCASLLVTGGADDLLGITPQRALSRALQSEPCVLPGIGHDVSLEAPHELAGLLNARLAHGARS